MFQIRPFELRTISWWLSKWDLIDLEPDYQRSGSRWTRKDKQYLIDTILNEYDIPKIYIADFSYYSSKLKKGTKPYAVIDGKQRLKAIWEFSKGDFPLANDFVYYDNPSLKLGGIYFAAIKYKYPEVADVFFNHNLNVMSVITDDEARINQIFLRLNSMAPLTGAEYRNAMEGPIPALIRRVAGHEFFTSRVRFSKAKGQDLELCAKLLVIEYFDGPTDTKKKDLDNFVKNGVQFTDDEIEALENRVDEVMDYMCGVFTNKDPLLKSQGPVSLYYLFMRSYMEENAKRLRRFLEAFQKLYTIVIKDIERAPAEISNDISDYKNFARSINDSGSILKRFKLLEKYYGMFDGKVIVTTRK